ncbi:hypothetical protein T492DRAFT_1128640 [Pavlovales sp. CCMP2436]|nr:hypothetical protein T492DRAFT_1128640 [Pavlovales sp. CCMP2436]
MLLLAEGAAVDAAAATGRSALAIAHALGHIEVAQLLVRNGAQLLSLHARTSGVRELRGADGEGDGPLLPEGLLPLLPSAVSALALPGALAVELPCYEDPMPPPVPVPAAAPTEEEEEEAAAAAEEEEAAAEAETAEEEEAETERGGEGGQEKNKGEARGEGEGESEGEAGGEGEGEGEEGGEGGDADSLLAAAAGGRVRARVPGPEEEEEEREKGGGEDAVDEEGGEEGGLQPWTTTPSPATASSPLISVGRGGAAREGAARMFEHADPLRKVAGGAGAETGSEGGGPGCQSRPLSL